VLIEQVAVIAISRFRRRAIAFMPSGMIHAMRR
jgi:hypothetical protein